MSASVSKFVKNVGKGGALMLVIVGLSATPSSSATVSFEGTISSVDFGLTTAFNTTMTMSGSFTVDELNPSLVGVGFARYPTSLLSVSIGGSYTGTDAVGGLFDVNDVAAAPDSVAFADFDIRSGTFASVGVLRADSFGWRLDDISGTALNSTAFPIAIDIADFPSIQNWSLTFKNSSGSRRRVSGLLTSISIAAPTPIPLPAALPLFAGGFGLLGVFVWRRKRMAIA